jgi:hypothetical protein
MYILTQVMGWEPAQVHVLLARVRKELRSKRIHSYLTVEFAYGRKPETK